MGYKDEMLQHRTSIDDTVTVVMLQHTLSFLCVCMAHSLVALVRNDTESE